LYYKLALQADAAGQTASAERNYQNAIDAYPILRADIIIRLSEVIYAENPIDSIRLLLRYFVDANDPKAIFDLSRHLGLIWEDLHDLDKAYCAYSKAFQQASSLDENLAPAEWRRDLVDRIALISNSIMTETLDCQAFWARLKASP
jgi:tetratricopeptide (TPR) repeat protein